MASIANAQVASPTAQVRTVSQEVSYVNSYQDITNLHYRFVELLDQRDNAGMAALFRNGSFELNYGGSLRATGEEDVLALLQQLFPTPPTAENWSRHIVSNLIIEIDDELGTAATRMYSSAWGVRAGQPSHFRGLGRHIGRFELIDGEWVFKELVIYADVDYPYPPEEPDQPADPPKLTIEQVVQAVFIAVADTFSRITAAVSDVMNVVVTNAVRLVNAVLSAVLPSTGTRQAAMLGAATDADTESFNASSVAKENEDAAASVSERIDDNATDHGTQPIKSSPDVLDTGQLEAATESDGSADLAEETAPEADPQGNEAVIGDAMDDEQTGFTHETGNENAAAGTGAESDEAASEESELDESTESDESAGDAGALGNGHSESSDGPNDDDTSAASQNKESSDAASSNSETAKSSASSPESN